MKYGQNRSDRICIRACGVDFHKWLRQRRKTETFGSALIQDTSTTCSKDAIIRLGCLVSAFYLIDWLLNQGHKIRFDEDGWRCCLTHVQCYSFLHAWRKKWFLTNQIRLWVLTARRMSFGITSASVVFQRSIEEFFAGYPCAIIVDDLLVWGEGTPEHDGN